jgi:hypothetical protein
MVHVLINGNEKVLFHRKFRCIIYIATISQYHLRGRQQIKGGFYSVLYGVKGGVERYLSR